MGKAERRRIAGDPGNNFTMDRSEGQKASADYLTRLHATAQAAITGHKTFTQDFVKGGVLVIALVFTFALTSRSHK